MSVSTRGAKVSPASTIVTIGSHAATARSDAGYPSRNSGDGVSPVTADLFDAAAVAAACGPVDVVFNGLNAPYPVWSDRLLPMLTAAADVAEALGARHIYPGSVYTFGASMPPRLTPDTPFAPTTLKGRLRAQAEAMFRARAEAGRLRTLVVRAGDFFGGAAVNVNAVRVASNMRASFQRGVRGVRIAPTPEPGS